MNGVSPLWGVCPFCDIQDELLNRSSKKKPPDDSKSVIVACFPYLLGKSNYRDINISKYAVAPDYHSAVLKRLGAACEKLSEIYPGERFAAFADASPAPEVKAARLAGLGVVGMNSLLITEKYGSYVFIGEIFSTLDLKSSSKPERACLKCGKCLRACPSGALSEAGLDVDLCLSAITQKKGALSETEERLIKESGLVWGCDVCQDVCPLNKNAALTELEEFLSSPVARFVAGGEIKGRAYEWRGKKVIERNASVCEKRKENDV